VLRGCWNVVVVEGLLEPQEELALHVGLLQRVHLHARADGDAAGRPGLDAGDVQVVEDLRAKEAGPTQLRGDSSHGLHHRADFLVEAINTSTTA
jgi:hypothetical protein